MSGYGVILFGVRSPLAVEYEESCHRCGIDVLAAVSVNGAPRVMDASRVVDLDRFDAAALPAGTVFITCAFSSARRQELARMAEGLGLAPAPALVDPTAVVAGSVRIGRNSFVNAGAVIGAVSLVGQGCLVNRAVSLGHHTVLGDHVSIGPGVNLASNVRVGDHAMIGVGATVVPNVRIGTGAIVGAGTLVRKDVADGVFVAGNPAVERPFDPSRSSLNVPDDE